MAIFSCLLKSVFHKFYYWRDSFSGKAWALEKMKDVFSKEININPEQIKIDDFSSFVESLYDEDGHLVQYPDFVMNAVSKMITNIIRSPLDVQEKDLNVMFKFLQSAVSLGQFDSGQRVSALFECMSNLLVSEKTADHMMLCQFDANFALLFAVAGAQNYTRKSAAEYFIQLVKFAFNESDVCVDSDGPKMKKARASLRDILMNLYHTFNKSLMQNLKSKSSNSPIQLDIIANYCRLLILCAENSPEWGDDVAFTGPSSSERIFNVWCDLLKHLSNHCYCDLGDVAVASVKQLAALASQRKSTQDGGEAFGMLSSLLLINITEPDSGVSVSDILVMVHCIVSRCDDWIHSPQTRDFLLDISILPLLIVLGVDHSSCLSHDTNSNMRHLVERTKEQIERESASRRSSLISHAVSNAFSLSENKDLLDGFKFASTIQYITFKTPEAPAGSARPFLLQGRVADRKALACLVSAFKGFKNTLENPSHQLQVYEAENIQTYVAPIISFLGISHSDVTTTLECYRKLLCRMEDCGKSVDKDCLMAVMEALELHLVNVDPNLRDMAVREMGRIYLFEMKTEQTELVQLTSKFLPSLWKCVRDKEENVVTQVFQFIRLVVETGKVEHYTGLLGHFNITQDELMTELQKCLLSSQWDNIKSAAFSLYSSLPLSPDVIRYAEICLQQSNSLAAPAVFRFIRKLFKIDNGCSFDDNDDTDLEAKIEGVSQVLRQGWGDLVLSVIHGDNTTCLRLAVDVLVSLDEFVNRENVVGFISRKVDDFMVVERVDGDGDVVGRIEELKTKVIQYSKDVLKGTLFVGLENTDISMVAEDDGDDENEGTERKIARKESQMEEEAAKELELEDTQMNSFQVDPFDHSAELQPFVLSEKPFPLPELVLSVLESYTSDYKYSVDDLFVLTGFRDVLHHLPLKCMQEEVYRSTDEYDRNTVTILQDIDESLDKTFKTHCKKLEKEVVEIFLTDFLEILENLMLCKEDISKLKIVHDSLTKLKRQMKQLSMCKEPFFQFVLSKRRKVIFGEVDGETLEFDSEFFDKGLKVLRNQFSKDISTKDYFSSSQGMKELLDTYFTQHNAIGDSGKVGYDASSSSSSSSNITGEKCLEEIHTKNGVSNNGSQISENDCNVSEVKDFHPFCSEDELLKSVGSVRESLDEINNSDNSIINTTTATKTTTELLMNLLERLIETCNHHLQHDKQIELQKMSSSVPLVDVVVMFNVVSQLKDYWWEMNEGGGWDRDNDPTVIDCY